MEQEYNSFNIIYCKEVSSGLKYNNSCGTIEYRGEKENQLALNWTLIENQEVGRLPILYR